MAWIGVTGMKLSYGTGPSVHLSPRRLACVGPAGSHRGWPNRSEYSKRRIDSVQVDSFCSAASGRTALARAATRAALERRQTNPLIERPGGRVSAVPASGARSAIWVGCVDVGADADQDRARQSVLLTISRILPPYPPGSPLRRLGSGRSGKSLQQQRLNGAVPSGIDNSFVSENGIRRGALSREESQQPDGGVGWQSSAKATG